MKKIVVFGDGQVGSNIIDLLPNPIIINRKSFDITDFSLLDEALEQINPDVIINTIAFTDVEGAEKKENQELCMKLNSFLPQKLAEYVHDNQRFLIHFSTDYVFDGKKTLPYTEEDRADPLNFYGISKYGGDVAIMASTDRFINLRTSWVYSNKQNNFVAKIMQKLLKGEGLKVVTDEVSMPTNALHLAQAVAYLLGLEQELLLKHAGVYNFCDQADNLKMGAGIPFSRLNQPSDLKPQASECTNEYMTEPKSSKITKDHLKMETGISRFEFAVAISKVLFDFGLIRSVPDIKPITSKEINTLAKRPCYSVLSTEKFSNTISQIKSIKDSGADERFKSETEGVYKQVHDRDRILPEHKKEYGREVSFKNGNWYKTFAYEIPLWHNDLPETIKQIKNASN